MFIDADKTRVAPDADEPGEMIALALLKGSAFLAQHAARRDWWDEDGYLHADRIRDFSTKAGYLSHGERRQLTSLVSLLDVNLPLYGIDLDAIEGVIAGLNAVVDMLEDRAESIRAYDRIVGTVADQPPTAASRPATP